MISHHSIWYPINLLAAGFLQASSNRRRPSSTAFHCALLLIAVPIHLAASLLVGLLYGAMLPMFPRRPILLGGVIAPLLWSGLLYSVLEFIESGHEPADRLALVRGFSNWVRCRGGHRRVQAGAHAHLAAPAVRRSRRAEAPGSWRTKRRGDRPAMTRQAISSVGGHFCWRAAPVTHARAAPGGSTRRSPPGRDHGLHVALCEELRGLPWSDGKGGAAIALGDPVYLAIADDATIRRVTANGVPGTPCRHLPRAPAAC